MAVQIRNSAVPNSEWVTVTPSVLKQTLLITGMESREISDQAQSTLSQTDATFRVTVKNIDPNSPTFGRYVALYVNETEALELTIVEASDLGVDPKKIGKPQLSPVEEAFFTAINAWRKSRGENIQGQISESKKQDFLSEFPDWFETNGFDPVEIG